MELLLLTSLLLCGAAIAGAFVCMFHSPQAAVLFAIMGGILGVVVAYVAIAIDKRDAPKPPVARGRRPGPRPNVAPAGVETPSPNGAAPATESRPRTEFRERMAKYLNVDESEVMQPDLFKSRMPFWSIGTIVSECWRTTTRTANEIRQVLIRIRNYVRGTRE